MNQQQRLIDHIIEELYPTPAEYMDDTRFMHLCDYACMLDELAIINYQSEDGESVVLYLNKQMDKYFSTTPEHEACCDVASTMESLLPVFKDCFKY